MSDKLANIEVGARLHAVYKADGEFYPAEVVTVSKAAKRSKAPVKVHYNGYDASEDAWVSIDQLKNKKLGLSGKPAEAKGKDKVKAKAKPEPKPDYSGLKKDLRLQVKADDDKYYVAEVVTVSKKTQYAKAPVKIHWVGYTAASDEWVGADRIRSKQLKYVKPKAKAKAKAKKTGPAEKLIKATCEVKGSGDAEGTIRLFQRGDSCTILYQIKGLTAGKHGLTLDGMADFSHSIEANAEGLAKGKMVDKSVRLDGDGAVVGKSFKVSVDEGKGDTAASGEINIVPGPIRATCEVSGGEESAPCTGKIWLRQVGEKCQIKYVIKGLSAGKHGFSIQDKADFSKGFEPNAKGVARGQFVDTLVKLSGDQSVLGKSCTVNSGADDQGKGGSKAASGEIKLVVEEAKPEAKPEESK